jgi:hypothetical protein
MVSDVYRFAPVATRYVSALAVARLCAQTAQAAIINLCALCSRGDAESRWASRSGGQSNEFSGWAATVGSYRSVSLGRTW